MTTTEMQERAVFIWGGNVATVEPGSNNEAFITTRDGYGHWLAANGHATCHPSCAKLEDAANARLETKAKREYVSFVEGPLSERERLLIHNFFVELHQRVKHDMMPGDPFYRQMEMLAHEMGAWENMPVNFGSFGGRLVPPKESN